MIYETPEHPAFTDWIVKDDLLRERLRIIDVGALGGLHSRWRWLGDYLEAWAFDPLPDAIERLKAANQAPDRIRYYNMGLGNQDGERLFSREDNPYGSSFLPSAVPETQLGRDAAGNLPSNWSLTPIRKLDSLMADGLIASIDHIKMDCEGFELEVLDGAQHFLDHSGVFAVESESSLKLHPWYQPCHFVQLYRRLGPRQFDVYDEHHYRVSREPFGDGYPHRSRPDTYDFLFLRGFGNGDDLNAHSLDRLIKMVVIAELYALQDIAADIVIRAADRLAGRFDPEKAVALLRQGWSTGRGAADKDKKIEDLHGEIAQLRGTIAANDERIGQQAAEIAQLRPAIEEQNSRIVQLDHDLAAMRNSRSWRLTAPLRHLRSWSTQ
jgi:FkbM family methyltransferase